MDPRFDPEESLRLATFAVGDEVFAIDIMRIREIVRPIPITPVPKAPFGMVGVFNLRGQVLPLFDLRLRFGAESKNRRREQDIRYLIVTLEGRFVGLKVDEVFEVLAVRRRDLRLAHTVLAGESADYFVAVLTLKERLVLLLNLHRLLAGAERIDLSGLAPPPAKEGFS